VLGPDYRTLHGAVIDEYGAIVERRLAGDTEGLGENSAPVVLHPPGISLEILYR
jgi:hypothetical protein